MKIVVSLLAVGIVAFSPHILIADQMNVLGTANSFAVLGASTVTNTGSSVLSGNVGVSPGTSITGFPPGTVINGTIDANDGAAIQGEADALSGFNSLNGKAVTQTLTGQDLGGLTLTPEVYFFASSAQLTGPLTLNFQGLNNVSFVFQTGSTLTTASGSSVNSINVGTNDSIYWAIGSSATLGTTTEFEGYLIANQSITMTTGATIQCGSAIALNGAVTLDSNVIGNGCSTGDGSGSGTPSAVPEPGTFAMFATGLLGAGRAIRRRFAA
jgi:type VI secretion system secreted protein VgrG